MASYSFALVSCALGTSIYSVCVDRGAEFQIEIRDDASSHIRSCFVGSDSDFEREIASEVGILHYHEMIQIPLPSSLVVAFNRWRGEQQRIDAQLFRQQIGVGIRNGGLAYSSPGAPSAKGGIYVRGGGWLCTVPAPTAASTSCDVATPHFDNESNPIDRLQ